MLMKIVFLNLYFHPDHSATSQSAAVSGQPPVTSRQPSAASRQQPQLPTANSVRSWYVVRVVELSTVPVFASLSRSQ
jgi:hypothetical protein